MVVAWLCERLLKIDSVGFCPDKVGEIGEISGLSGRIFVWLRG